MTEQEWGNLKKEKKEKKKHFEDAQNVWHVAIHADTGHARRCDFNDLWFLNKVGETGWPGRLGTLSFYAILFNC